MKTQALFTLVVAGCLLTACGRSKPAPVVSPDGSMVAEIDDGHLEVMVNIRDKSGPVLYSWHTGASRRMRYSVKWQNDKTLLLDSGDIGTLILVRMSDHTWRTASPGQAFSPDGKWLSETTWRDGARKLRIAFGEVTGDRLHDNTIHHSYDTELVVADPFDCARWENDRRVIVTAVDGEHAWIKQADGSWIQENSAGVKD